jgi:hypothetical protein
MQDATKTQELFSQLTGKTIDTMTVWAETNQRVLRELVDLSAGAAKEGVRLYSELSRSAIEAFRDNQAGVLRWQATWKDATIDPLAWCHKAMAEGVQYAQQAARHVEENVQVLSRSVERLQASTEQTGKGIQESLAGATSKLKDIYKAG